MRGLPGMMMRTQTRPRAVTVRSAKTPALASRDRIAGTAIRASTRSPRPRRPSRARAHGAVAMAVEAVELDDERYDLDPADMFDEPTVSIPISFFSILNVTPARASPAAIEAAYAGVINRELVEGFSDGEFILVFVGEIRLTSCLCLFYRMPRRPGRSDRRSRAGPLRPDLRREHEDDVKNGRLTPVPASQLGGALALMQEAGEHESVIEYAPECLAVRFRR